MFQNSGITVKPLLITVVNGPMFWCAICESFQMWPIVCRWLFTYEQNLVLLSAKFSVQKRLFYFAYLQCV